jgi:hypothetical protein
MKKVCFSLFIALCLFITGANAQTHVKGTIADEGSNKIGIYGEPDAALNNVLFRNINITFSIADQGAGNPTNAQIVLNSGIPNLDLVPVNTAGGNPYLPGDGRAYYSYIMSDNGLVTTSTWPANTKANLIAEFTFPTNSYFSSLRMDDVSPTGGLNSQMYWYVEVIGPGDITDYNTMFFGTALLPPTNNAGAAPSFVPLQPITVIPVKFVNFTVTKSNSNAILKWDVANEDANTDHYELERSFNGADFVKFATVSRNSGSTTSTYTSTDENIVARAGASNIVYYRVKQVDRDGKFVYTDIKNIKLSGIKGFDAGIFPNPVTTTATVNVDLITAGNISIFITDASGKELQKISMAGSVGGNTKKVNMSGFATGTYLFKISCGNENKVLKVVKNNK